MDFWKILQWWCLDVPKIFLQTAHIDASETAFRDDIDDNSDGNNYKDIKTYEDIKILFIIWFIIWF